MTRQSEPPGSALVDMAQSYFRGKVLCAAVRLGIADALGDGEKQLDELAAATASNPDSLYRLLRGLASIGAVEEVAPARFALTPLGQPLRKDAPHSVSASIVFWADLLADFWTYLPECVRAGGSSGATAAMEREGVKSRWSRHPDAKAIFHAVFAEPGADAMAPLASAYDFSRCRLIADLGGAGGGLLAAILRANPQLRGILVDRREAVEGAAPRLAAAGLAGRCDLIAGDLLEAIPAGADVYILKCVLHGYGDDDARRILQNCAAAMQAGARILSRTHGGGNPFPRDLARNPDVRRDRTSGSRLLVIEAVLPATISRADPAVERLAMSDLNMLAVTGGRERSETEWESLLTSAGFELRRVVPVPGQDSSIIEAVPGESSNLSGTAH